MKHKNVFYVSHEILLLKTLRKESKRKFIINFTQRDIRLIINSVQDATWIYKAEIDFQKIMFSRMGVIEEGLFL